MDEILKALQSNSDLLKRYAIGEIYVFGSFAKGSDNENSDVDLIVKFIEPVGLFEFIRLKNELEALLGKKVDLVSADAIHPDLADGIWKEAVRAA